MYELADRASHGPPDRAAVWLGSNPPVNSPRAERVPQTLYLLTAANPPVNRQRVPDSLAVNPANLGVNNGERGERVLGSFRPVPEHSCGRSVNSPRVLAGTP